MPLIQDTELGQWMGKKVDHQRAEASIRMAEGLLMAATRMDPWPSCTDAAAPPVPPDLWSWCVELAALCYVNNPRQMTQRTVGGVTTAWAPDDTARREAILTAARSRYNTSGGPRGSFPAPQPWPDPYSITPIGYGIPPVGYPS